MHNHPVVQLGRARAKIAVLILIACILTLPLSGCSQVIDTISSVAGEDPTPTQQTSTAVDQDNDYFVVTGTAQREHQTQPGKIEYCDLDELERATCAYGELTQRTFGRSEQDLPDPAGWPEHNGEVNIPALDGVEGSKAYHGWMFNRSHLIADSLGGAPEAENLVTGTRTQNVGSHQEHGQYAGGMAHTEVIARDYLETASAKDCPLYYAATPNYTGDELIPRTVTVDIQSCDKSIDERVEVSNTAAGFEIDYTTGEYQEVG